MCQDDYSCNGCLNVRDWEIKQWLILTKGVHIRTLKIVRFYLLYERKGTSGD